MLQKFGICTCHNKNNPINAKGLCPEGARERHEHSATMKNMVVKKNRNNLEIEIEDRNETTERQHDGEAFYERTSRKSTGNSRENYPSQSHKSNEKSTFTCKKIRIKPRSEKNKEIVAQELLMFKQIWEERPHFCEVTGKPLGAFDVRLFSHVLTKGAYPKFRLYKKNIVLCLYEKHFEWEFKTRKTLEFSWIETLESSLKTEYYKK